jgi:hypothetical protein
MPKKYFRRKLITVLNFLNKNILVKQHDLGCGFYERVHDMSSGILETPLHINLI